MVGASKKIVHIGKANPILSRYFSFLAEYKDLGNHLLLLTAQPAETGMRYPIETVSGHGFWGSIKALIHIWRAEKVILHGMFSQRFVCLLLLCPSAWRRSFWVMWGGDLYRESLSGGLFWRVAESLRPRLIRRIGYLVTYLSGDVALARTRYGATGKVCHCIMYPSNTIGELKHEKVSAVADGEEPAQRPASLRVLVGNSADPSNNHEELFGLLAALPNQGFEVICPLAYGDRSNASKIKKAGSELFGERFQALLEFMEYEAYLQVLRGVDLALMGQRRQQGMGNNINLLWLGKKLFLWPEGSPWALFQELGLSVYNLNELDLNPLAEEKARSNRSIIEASFTLASLRAQWEAIFAR